MEKKLKSVFFDLMNRQYPSFSFDKYNKTISVRPSYIIGSMGTFFIKIYGEPTQTYSPIMELEVSCRTKTNPKFNIEFELIAVYSDESRFVKKIMSLSDISFINLINEWLLERGLNDVYEEVFNWYMLNSKVPKTFLTSTTFNPYEYSNSTY